MVSRAVRWASTEVAETSAAIADGVVAEAGTGALTSSIAQMSVLSPATSTAASTTTTNCGACKR